MSTPASRYESGSAGDALGGAQCGLGGRRGGVGRRIGLSRGVAHCKVRGGDFTGNAPGSLPPDHTPLPGGVVRGHAQQRQQLSLQQYAWIIGVAVILALLLHLLGRHPHTVSDRRDPGVHRQSRRRAGAKRIACRARWGPCWWWRHGPRGVRADPGADAAGAFGVRAAAASPARPRRAAADQVRAVARREIRHRHCNSIWLRSRR